LTTEQEHLLDVRAYPNPTFGNVTLELNGFDAGAGEIVLSDLRGRVFMRRNETLIKGHQTIPLRIETKIKGYFIIEIFQGDKRKAVQVIRL
jgi:hypothetical protein